jgi:acyl-coenzyme A synthetase/AMP-(fatty) acid ligase
MTNNVISKFIKKSNNVAIYYRGKEITYSDVYDNVNKYANALKHIVNVGDKIMIVLPDCPEFIYLFWGAVKIGAVPVLINPGLTELEFLHVKGKSKPVVVFNNLNISEFAVNAVDSTEVDEFKNENDSVCFYMYSSGTTGYLKEIPHYHNDIVVTCETYAANTLNIKKDDVLYSSAKLFFAYGFGNSMSFPFYFDASTILVSEPPTSKVVLDTIERYRPTIYFGVPSIYAQQVKSLKTAKRDLTSLRVCVSAGEPLPGKLLDDWMQITNTVILDGIGSTEALHIFISNTIETIEPNCSGKIVPGYSARIVNPTSGNLIPDGELGDLYITGGSLSTHNSEWLNTGDMYIKRGEKYYYQGRSNDMLKVGGVWVSPAEIEAKIVEHDGVVEAGVVIGTNVAGLLKPKAFVVLADPNNKNIATKNSIKRKCMSELPANHYPQWIDFVDELPKTATGKIQRYILRTYDPFSAPDLND